jgi:hypothetical protein
MNAMTMPCDPPKNCPTHRINPVSKPSNSVVFNVFDIIVHLRGAIRRVER